MGRLCERPGCSDVASMAYGFDVDRLLVWLALRDPMGDGLRAGSLCKRHADAMVVPLGWTLDDRRDAVPRLFKAPADETTQRAKPTRRPRSSDRGSEQLALDTVAPVEEAAADELPESPSARTDEDVRTVAAVTGELLADDPDATVAIPWMPDFDQQDDLDGVLAARSPLLARAFRGTDRPR